MNFLDIILSFIFIITTVFSKAFEITWKQLKGLIEGKSTTSKELTDQKNKQEKDSSSLPTTKKSEEDGTLTYSGQEEINRAMNDGTWSDGSSIERNDDNEEELEINNDGGDESSTQELEHVSDSSNATESSEEVLTSGSGSDECEPHAACMNQNVENIDSNNNLPSQTVEQTTREEENSSIPTSTLTDEDKKQNTKEFKPINVELDFNINNFYSSFNKPGDCIKRLFKGIENDPIFQEENEDSNPLSLDSSAIPKDIFKGNGSNNKIVSACYIYNYKYDDNKKQQRLEIGVATPNEGWVWMMGSKPSEKSPNTNQKTWYREFLIKRDAQNNWKVNFGHEGIVEVKYQYHLPQDILKIANGFASNENHKWILFNDNSQCIHNCESKNNRAFASYWKPSSSDKIFSNLWNNAEEQILRLGKYKEEIYGFHYHDQTQLKVNSRQRIYKDDKWYKKINSYEKIELFKLNDDDLKKTKGKWEDLYKLCKDSSQEIDEYSKLYCWDTN